MKKTITALLIICTMLFSSACVSLNNPNPDEILFYYCNQDIGFNTSNDVITAEKRSTHEIGSDLQSIVTEYLRGPKTPGLTLLLSPNTSLVEIQRIDDTLQITLSEECADMSELDLSISCACLVKTLFPYTDAAKITVTAEGGFSRFEKPLTFTSDSILTDDTATQAN